MNNLILEVRGLGKYYENFQIRDLNLKIYEGEVVGFIGANGAGKSTTIKSILNIIDIDSGEMLFQGNDIRDNEIDSKLKIGYVGETTRFYNDISLKMLYKFVKESYGDYWDDGYFNNLINNVFKLNLNNKIKELSKGMVVKFMIAIALAHNPKLLILDEPTSGLDPVIREEVLDILLDLNRQKNTTIFMSSHISEDIKSICNRVVFIDSGEILADMNIKDVLKKYRKININELDNVHKIILKNISVEVKGFYLFDIDDIQNDIDKNVTEEASLSEILLYLKNKDLREV